MNTTKVYTMKDINNIAQNVYIFHPPKADQCR